MDKPRENAPTHATPTLNPKPNTPNPIHRTQYATHPPPGLLKDKAVILVTHQLAFAPLADRLVLLEDGCITQEGPFTALVADPEATGYAAVLRSHAHAASAGHTDAPTADDTPDVETSPPPSRDEGASPAAAVAKAGPVAGPLGEGTAEDRAIGGVTFATYRSYFRYGGGRMGGYIVIPIAVRWARAGAGPALSKGHTLSSLVKRMGRGIRNQLAMTVAQAGYVAADFVLASWTLDVSHH